MKNLKLSTLIIASALSLTLASCHKDKVVKPVVTPVTDGFYVLNQGGYTDNNSSLSFYSYTTKQVTPDIFASANGGGLGDTGNDIEIYGSKMYIIVNYSSYIDVVDPTTAKLIKQIKMFNGAVAREPRDVVFYKGDAYVSSYDGTVAVIDTASLTITKNITVGRNPEQLAIANGKIYVANSGGLDNPNYDKTVSVIDLATQAVIKTLTVVINPQNVSADANGNVYVLSAGDYNTITPSLAVIDDNADVVKSQTNFDATTFTVQGDNGYFITAEGKVGVYNTQTQTISQASFISDGTAITTPFAVAADVSTGEVFVTDAKDYSSNGQVFVFDKTGKKEYAVTAGIIPGKIALLKK
jgi:YVTN family beta-propeller protein